MFLLEFGFVIVFCFYCCINVDLPPLQVTHNPKTSLTSSCCLCTGMCGLECVTDAFFWDSFNVNDYVLFLFFAEASSLEI